MNNNILASLLRKKQPQNTVVSVADLDAMDRRAQLARGRAEDRQPVKHWTQGMAQLLDAHTANRRERSAKDSRKSHNQALAEALGQRGEEGYSAEQLATIGALDPERAGTIQQEQIARQQALADQQNQRTQSLSEPFDEYQMAVDRGMFDGSYEDYRRLGQQGVSNVHSTFTAEDGSMYLVGRDGALTNTGTKVRNPLKTIDLGGGATGTLDPLSGGVEQVTSPEDVANNAAIASRIGAQSTASTEAELGLPEATAKAEEFIDVIDRLLPDDPSTPQVTGDLASGFEKGYGRRVPIDIPGTERNDAMSQARRLVAVRTLQEADKLKGVLSDKDMAMLGEAATVLSDRGISDAEAERALRDMRRILTEGLARQKTRAAGNPAAIMHTPPPNAGSNVPAMPPADDDALINKYLQ